MLIYVFVTALTLLFILIAMKMFEQRRGKRLIVLSVLSAKDDYLRLKFSNIRDNIARTEGAIYMFFSVGISRAVKLFMLKVLEFGKAKYESLLFDVRGYRNIRENPNVSEFLRHISAHKQASGKGRIDDSLGSL